RIGSHRSITIRQDIERTWKEYRNSKQSNLPKLMSEEIPEPTDLRTICSTLEHFSLPAALCSIEDNRLVIWNQLFQKGSGLSEDELAQTGLSSLILLDETYGGSILENGHPTHFVRFVPCVLKNSLLNEWMPGRALKRSDGMSLALFGLPVGDVAFEGFI